MIENKLKTVLCANGNEEHIMLYTHPVTVQLSGGNFPEPIYERPCNFCSYDCAAKYDFTMRFADDAVREQSFMDDETNAEYGYPHDAR